MKRKVLALACTLALSAGLLAGCGSSTDTAAEAESTVAAVESTEAAEAGFVNLKGHRLVGGMRASIYNAMPAEGVDKLVDFMEKFRKENA